MKKVLCIVFALFLSVVAAGCSDTGDIVGVWEQAMEISILGLEKADSTMSVTRFTFLADGTGSQEQIIPDKSYPDAIRAFSYDLDGDMLTLHYGDGQMVTYTVLLNKNSFQLKSNRIDYQLERVQE